MSTKRRERVTGGALLTGISFFIVTLIAVSGSALAQSGERLAFDAGSADASLAPAPGSPYWSALIPSGTVPGAVDQPVAFYAELLGNPSSALTEESALEYVQLEVRNAETDAVISGQLAYDGIPQLLLWTPGSPLEEGLSYDVAVVFENQRMAQEQGLDSTQADLMGNFLVAMGPATTAIDPPRVAGSLLSEYESFEQACCSDNQLMCDEFGSCFGCINYSVAAPSLNVSWTNDNPGAPFVWYRVYVIQPDGVEQPHSIESALSSTEHSTTVFYEEVAEEYCVRIEAITLAGDSSSTTHCVADGERMTLELPEPDLSALEQCRDVDPGTLDGGGPPNEGGSGSGGGDCGCEIRGESPGDAPLLLMVFLLGMGSLYVGFRNAFARTS